MKSVDIITLREPKSIVSEVYRTLRTNIKFSSFKGDIKTIAITSPWINEGKSTITANLGITIALSGSRVLIIDGDLRNPTIHKTFHVSNDVGFTNILVDNIPYRDVIFHCEINNLDLMLCGPKPPNPSELLGSLKVKTLLQNLKEDYDYILIDTPPVTVVTDAALIASICDGSLLVIASGQTVIENAIKARDLLKNVSARILGVVLNKVKSDKPSKHSNYNYYYNQSDKAKKAKKRKRFKR